MNKDIRTDHVSDPTHSQPPAPAKSAYDNTVKKAKITAERLGGETVTNYIPYQNCLMLRGVGKISKSNLLKPKIQDVFEEAIGFRFRIVGIGSDVKGLLLGDTVDIKSTSMLSLRPLIPNKNSIVSWRERLKVDREAMIAHGVKEAEDPSKIGRTLLASTSTAMKELQTGGIFNLEEQVEIVEYFSTEDHNISGVFHIVETVQNSVHESKK